MKMKNVGGSPGSPGALVTLEAGTCCLDTRTQQSTRLHGLRRPTHKLMKLGHFTLMKNRIFIGREIPNIGHSGQEQD